MTLSDTHKRYLYAYLFFLPFGAFFTVFKIIPFVQAFRLTFYKWDIFGAPAFIGLLNYQKVFTTARFWQTLWHTIYFTLLTVPPLVLLGFLLAVLVNARIFFKGFFRSAFYAPYVLSISVVCLTWQLLYNPSFGVFNGMLSGVGLEPVRWLMDKNWAMPAVAVTTVWWTIGFNFLVYLAGLQQISSTYYEAAEIDGASGWQQLVYITFPLLKRSHILVTVLQVIASLQIFGQVYIMTGGGPGGSTRVTIQYIYEEGFRYFHMGYAQTVAFVFFVLMIGVSFAQIRLMLRREEG